ncbi:MerR family DNA-binding protein [Belnapia sp. T6]|uniref:MerR family DNA-binding protein n=1 Tax=Belnapia mucosa TaxID=2804532 RepID=A0ABS1V698_9PROT|nr:MerR family DNA-binding protein [Belnapia mucosa]MBL6456666.1 MerR family DNA-binding protein [Belnapia mucosa]
MAAGLTIGRAAREAGVGVETIRFYERQRLVAQPPKPQGTGVRLYPTDTVERIRFIKKAQELGFSLREIQELLALRSDPAAGCADVRDRATAKLEDVRRKIQHLQNISGMLEQLIAACLGSGGLQACAIMDALSRHDADDMACCSASGRGSDASLKDVAFRIENLPCGDCASAIKEVLEKEPGVKAVSFDKGETRILYDLRTIDKERLAAAIESSGFRIAGHQ